MMFTSWMLAHTWYIPYVGGVIKIESTRGVHATRMTKSIASSLPTPRKMLLVCTLLSPALAFLNDRNTPKRCQNRYIATLCAKAVWQQNRARSPEISKRLLQLALVWVWVSFKDLLAQCMVRIQWWTETVLIRIQQHTYTAICTPLSVQGSIEAAAPYPCSALPYLGRSHHARNGMA